MDASLWLLTLSGGAGSSLLISFFEQQAFRRRFGRAIDDLSPVIFWGSSVVWGLIIGLLASAAIIDSSPASVLIAVGMILGLTMLRVTEILNSLFLDEMCKRANERSSDHGH